MLAIVTAKRVDLTSQRQLSKKTAPPTLVRFLSGHFLVALFQFLMLNVFKPHSLLTVRLGVLFCMTSMEKSLIALAKRDQHGYKHRVQSQLLRICTTAQLFNFQSAKKWGQKNTPTKSHKKIMRFCRNIFLILYPPYRARSIKKSKKYIPPAVVWQR